MRSKLTLAALAVMVMIFAFIRVGSAHQRSEQQSSTGQSIDGMDMQQDASGAVRELNSATPAMSSHHMEIGPHMKMTALRQPTPGDQDRAQKIVDEARQVMDKYQDYHDALNEGFKIFLPNVPQKQYHFTNYRYAIEAGFHFNPEHPTSLLYDKTADGYKLAGAMYTASAKATEDELNARVPLSVAQWHEHVNFCFAPKGHESEGWEANPKFGFAGSIATKEDCDQARGRFVPLLFGWMVHVYPYEKNPADIWAMGPGMQEH